MSGDRTLVIPALSLNYVGDRLDSISLGGEEYLSTRYRHDTCFSMDDSCFECSECGFHDADVAPYEYNFCPGCGRRVEV